MEQILNNGLILPQSGYEITSKEEMSYEEGKGTAHNYLSASTFRFYLRMASYEVDALTWLHRDAGDFIEWALGFIPWNIGGSVVFAIKTAFKASNMKSLLGYDKAQSLRDFASKWNSDIYLGSTWWFWNCTNYF